MKKQYIVSKYVMADSMEEAKKKSKKMPVHEIYVHNSWFEKQNFEWEQNKTNNRTGFVK